MLTTLFILGALLLITYIATFCFKNRTIPASISETYYLVKKPAIFSVILTASTILITPKMMESISEQYTFLAFLICLSLLLIAAAPNFTKGTQKWIHTIAAIIMLVSSFFYVGYICGWLHLLWLVYIAGIVYHTIRNMRDRIPFYPAFVRTCPMFWAEILVLVTVFIAALWK